MTDHQELSNRMQSLEEALREIQVSHTSDMRGLGSRLAQLEIILAGPPAVSSRLHDQETKTMVTEQSIKEVERRLISIEGTLAWLFRIVAGAIILAIVNFILSGGLSSVSIS